MRAVKYFMIVVALFTVGEMILLYKVSPESTQIMRLLAFAVSNMVFWFAIALFVRWIVLRVRKSRKRQGDDDEWRGPDPGLVKEELPASWVPVKSPGGRKYNTTRRSGWVVDEWLHSRGALTYYEPKWFQLKDCAHDFTDAVSEFVKWCWNNIAYMEVKGIPHENDMGNVMLLAPNQEFFYSDETRALHKALGVHIVQIDESGNVFDSTAQQPLVPVELSDFEKANRRIVGVCGAIVILGLAIALACIIGADSSNIDDVLLAIISTVTIVVAVILVRRYNVTKAKQNANARKGRRAERVERILDFRRAVKSIDVLWQFENREGKIPEQWEPIKAPYSRRYAGFGMNSGQSWLRLKEGCADVSGALSAIIPWRAKCMQFNQEGTARSQYGDNVLLLLADWPKEEVRLHEKALCHEWDVHPVTLMPEFTLVDEIDRTEHKAIFDKLERPPSADPDFRIMPGKPEDEEAFWRGEGRLPLQFMSCANPLLQEDQVDLTHISAWLLMREPFGSYSEFERVVSELLEWKRQRDNYHEQICGKASFKGELVVVLPFDRQLVSKLPESIKEELADLSIVFGECESDIDEVYLSDLVTGDVYVGVKNRLGLHLKLDGQEDEEGGSTAAASGDPTDARGRLDGLDAEWRDESMLISRKCYEDARTYLAEADAKNNGHRLETFDQLMKRAYDQMARSSRYGRLETEDEHLWALFYDSPLKDCRDYGSQNTYLEDFLWYELPDGDGLEQIAVAALSLKLFGLGFVKRIKRPVKYPKPEEEVIDCLVLTMRGGWSDKGLQAAAVLHELVLGKLVLLLEQFDEGTRCLRDAETGAVFRLKSEFVGWNSADSAESYYSRCLVCERAAGHE